MKKLLIILLRVKLKMMNYSVHLTTNCVDTFAINEISQNTINVFQLNSCTRNQLFVNGFYIMNYHHLFHECTYFIVNSSVVFIFEHIKVTHILLFW